MLHVTCLSPHAETPTYMLTCGHTLQRTVIDPLHPVQVQEALGSHPLDLILLTSDSQLTMDAADVLTHRTGGPILASSALTTSFLPVARYLKDGDVVGLGPLAQTIYMPEGSIMCYAMGSEGMLFAGSLFATGASAQKANRMAISKLHALPSDTTVYGGGTPHGQPLGPLLEKFR